MLVAQPCLTLCDPMDCSPPGSSVHEIFQARSGVLFPSPMPMERQALLRVPTASLGCPGGSVVKNHLPMQEMQEMWVRSLGWEDPLEKEMATYSSILSWKIPWTEVPSGLQAMGSETAGHDLATKQHHFVLELPLLFSCC